MLYVKALHIIFVVTWFAGLFYIVRLFIYFAETVDKPEVEKAILQKQFSIMQRRLWYGITWPSAIITLGCGLYLLQNYPILPSWLSIKLLFVLGLYIYHFLCHFIFLQQQKGVLKYSSTQLRFWNEVATIFLVGIVFLVVLKDFTSLVWVLSSLLVLSLILILAIKIYKNFREKK
jgi:putative membrane protein